VGTATASFAGLRNQQLSHKVLAEPCRILVDDLAVARLGAQVCSSKEIAVLSAKNEPQKFSVSDESPCVLRVE
jgi:hypothetical protein